MTYAAGPPIGEAPINLRAHEIRCGNAEGAREDFEAMLAELVQVSYPDAVRIQASGGDGGIDVMAGDPRGGSITIWQAKYFVGIGRHQQGQIRSSFTAAVDEAARQGYHIAEWVLCVPVDLTREARRWWDGWRDGAEAATGIRVKFWGATELRGLLIRPGAQAIRAHYYGSVRPMPIDLYPTVFVAEPVQVESWEPGGEQRLGGHTYLVHDDATEIADPGGSWLWHEASADCLDAGPARVRLAQIRVLRPTPAAEALRTGLRDQARLLRALSGGGGGDSRGLCIATTRRSSPCIPVAPPGGTPSGRGRAGRRTGSPPP